MAYNDNMRLFTEVNGTISRCGMLDGAGSILVAYSGGADSSALLHIMKAIGDKLDITVAAAHVDHMIRGDEAERDREFCEHTCKELGIQLHVLKCDVPAYAKESHMSLEEAARKVRYDFFESLMNEHGYDRTATAHHAGDNAETVLFNLIRGASPDGIGIPPVRGKYIRPLITLTKQDLLDYCTKNGIGYVTDSTNSDTDYTRNYIRHVLIPECEKLNSSVTDALTRFSILAMADTEYLASEASKIPEDADADTLRAIPDVLLSRFVRRQYDKAAPDYQLTYEQTRGIIGLIRSRSLNKSRSLPGGITFTLRRNGVEFSRETRLRAEFKFELEQGSYVIEETGDTVYIARSGKNEAENCTQTKDINDLKNIYRLFIHKSVNSDKISKSVIIRSRCNGDTLRLGGMTRSVKKLIQSKRMTTSMTDVLPFFCGSDGSIIWIPGFEVSDGYRTDTVTNASQTVELYWFHDRITSEN